MVRIISMLFESGFSILPVYIIYHTYAVERLIRKAASTLDGQLLGHFYAPNALTKDLVCCPVLAVRDTLVTEQVLDVLPTFSNLSFIYWARMVSHAYLDNVRSVARSKMKE